MRFAVFVIAVILLAIPSSGCAHYFGDLSAISGSNVADLKRARANGKTQTVLLSYEEAFNKIKDILKEEELVIFQASKKAKYIVAMGFPKQIDTTRVGIFFEEIEKNKTRITLSSLSPIALEKAEIIIFGKLE